MIDPYRDRLAACAPGGMWLGYASPHAALRSGSQTTPPTTSNNRSNKSVTYVIGRKCYPCIGTFTIHSELTIAPGASLFPGAMVGGLVLGLLEAFAASYLSLLTGGAFGAEYKDIFAFSALILILIFRPKGLLGEVVRERA
jgi:hypothetical protein